MSIGLLLLLLLLGVENEHALVQCRFFSQRKPLKRSSFGKALSFLDSHSQSENLNTVKSEKVLETSSSSQKTTEEEEASSATQVAMNQTDVRVARSDSQSDEHDGDSNTVEEADQGASCKSDLSCAQLDADAGEADEKSDATREKIGKSLWSMSQPCIKSGEAETNDTPEVTNAGLRVDSEQARNGVRSKYFSDSGSSRVATSPRRSRSFDVLPGEMMTLCVANFLIQVRNAIRSQFLLVVFVGAKRSGRGGCRSSGLSRKSSQKLLLKDQRSIKSFFTSPK